MFTVGSYGGISHLLTHLISFDDYDPNKGIDLEMNEESTIEELIQTLRLPQNEGRVILINGISKRITDFIKDGDQIKIFTPLGGG